MDDIRREEEMHHGDIWTSEQPGVVNKDNELLIPAFDFVTKEVRAQKIILV